MLDHVLTHVSTRLIFILHHMVSQPKTQQDTGGTNRLLSKASQISYDHFMLNIYERWNL